MLRVCAPGAPSRRSLSSLAGSSRREFYVLGDYGEPGRTGRSAVAETAFLRSTRSGASGVSGAATGGGASLTVHASGAARLDAGDGVPRDVARGRAAFVEVTSFSRPRMA